MIKYVVYNTVTGKYYSGGNSCKSDLEGAKLYKRTFDASYRRRVLTPWKLQNQNPHIVLPVKVRLEIIDG